jgi:hypothetical protein
MVWWWDVNKKIIWENPQWCIRESEKQTLKQKGIKSDCSKTNE